MIDGASLADLAQVGLFPTDSTAPGVEVLAGVDPGACEIAGGVLIGQGHTDVSQEQQTAALTLGTRVVAVGGDTFDDTFLFTVHDRSGMRRHLLHTLAEPAVSVGDPLPEESESTVVDARSALALFERVTGVGIGELDATPFVLLRPAQEHDEAPGRSWFRRLFGLHSSESGYADKTGPPVLDAPPGQRP